ncbi:hypothetical protein PN462_16400 [Spirulina sp. CS-785/01]|uniref:hypothetical protein n=1 Tax=Spirulina sp. CS-785/01 TaxID=3021716 RepID=UPI00232F24AC|nr:hypothetical protein [Spirulina sp. CS-785/01]MDB9314695.1 hypothetical protein [Spirulina sp. CS-785/01]
MKHTIWTTIIFVMLFCGAFGLTVFSQTPPSPHFDYTISGCEGYQTHLPEVVRTPDNTRSSRPMASNLIQNLEIHSDSQAFSFSHGLTYVCCADFELSSDIDQEEKVITVVERNVGEYCRCICNYTVTGEFADLPTGNYELRVYLQEKNVEQLQFLFNQNITVNN